MKFVAENTQWLHVKGKKTLKEMWDAWKALHITNNQRINVYYHFEDFYTWKYIDDTNMANHVASMLNLWHKILAAGEDLSDIHITQALVLLLLQTPSWDLIKIQLFNLDTMKLTSETIATTLQAEVNHHQHDKMSKTAMLAAKRAFGSKGKMKDKGKPGLRPDDECQHCHKKGHWISKCPKCKAEEKKTGAGTASLTINNLWDLGSGSSSLGYTEWIFMAESIPNRGELLLDLAATSHMLLDHSLFMSYTPVISHTPHDFISIGDARDFPVTGHGTVVFEAQLPNGYHKVTLCNALHIPKLAANLVSLGTLQRQGASVVSYKNGLSLRFNGQEVFHASLVGTLYHINCCQIQTISTYVVTSESLRLWH